MPRGGPLCGGWRKTLTRAAPCANRGAATFDADEPELASEYDVRAFVNCDFREEQLTTAGLTYEAVVALCPKFVKIASDQGFEGIEINWNGLNP